MAPWGISGSMDDPSTEIAKSLATGVKMTRGLFIQSPVRRKLS